MAPDDLAAVEAKAAQDEAARDRVKKDEDVDRDNTADSVNSMGD